MTSQFEQQVRAVCGLPLGSTALHPCRRDGRTCSATSGSAASRDWDAALAVPGVKLHLYGKRDPRPGRKMGHLTAVADTPTEAIQKVLAARDVL